MSIKVLHSVIKFHVYLELACKHDCLWGKKEGEESRQSVDIIT
jgi:hypothetical protein